MRLAIAAFIAGLATVTAAASGQPAWNPYAHVRAMQKEGAGLIEVGMANSATFRRLVNRIESSDVIVYIDVRPMPDHLGGNLRFVARSATDRFLRIQLNRALSEGTLVAFLGHELQHAVEVADAPDLSSAEDLRDLYRRVGVRTGTDSYDSLAARQAGYVVRDELVRSRTAGVRVAHAASDRLPRDSALGDDLPSESLAPAATGDAAHGRS
jgi:hypothetical protein